MRVLCFGRFCDEQPGGIQSHVLSLLESLRAEVDFLNLVPSRNFQRQRFTRAGTPVVRTAGWDVDGSLVLSPGLALEAWRQHRARPFDLVHLHFPDPMSHLASLVIPARVPRVITWHAEIVRQQYLLKLYRPWQNRGLRRAGAIIVAAPENRRASPDLLLPGIPDKVRVIPFGFDLTRFAQPDAETLAGAARLRAAHPGKKLVFALGRHVSYKGFDVLIQALAGLGPDVRLLLGGEGPLRPTLERQATRLGLQDRVCFLGRIPEARLAAHYQACDVFCLPSVTKAEAFGIVQLEAMAAGRPVVSTRLGNGVDFVNQEGKTGLTVPPGNVAALTAALAALLAREDWRKELGRAAQRRALSEFQRERMAASTLALYRAVLQAQKP
ncbi:MAG: glycosyltransferase [Zoogloeaceae bacterium]|jgi:rhamnosyl/mannosyltransferase|nr:glycosyltransferase [Zoogloeaceae bacterium]